MTKEQLWEQLKDLPYGSMRQNDVEAIFKIAERLPKGITILEIGSLIGKSAITWAVATEGIVYTVNFNDNKKEILENAEKFGLKDRIFPFTSDSAKFEWDKEVDMVYVDGSHDASSLIKDLQRYDKFAKKLICGHDYDNKIIPFPDVKTVVDAYYKDVEVVDYIWCNWKKPIIDIVSLFIGKDYCLRHYFEGLEKLDYPKDRINLIWHDTSHILKFTEKLSKWITDNGNKYRSVNLIQCRDPHFHFEEENQTGDTLYIITEAYNHALNYCKSDYFLAFEDDTIPPPDGLNKLLDIVKGDVKGACGVNLYRPSIPGFNQTPILWNFEKKETFPGEGIEAEFDAVKIDNLGTGIEFIGSGHLGFTLLNGDWLRENKFELKIGKVVGCDINLGNRMRLQNYKYAIDWSIKCKHYDIDGNYV